MSQIFLIAAVAHGNIIGKDNDMPWKDRFEKDLEFFRATTKGHPVIMGRATHESIGRVLPDRPNIVVTRNAKYQTPYTKNTQLVEVAQSLEDALQKAKAHTKGDVFVIGGADLYAQAITQADGIYLTELDFTCPESDAAAYKRFPTVEESLWRVEHAETVIDGTDKMRFLRYMRKK